jgi:hypothetical protein
LLTSPTALEKVNPKKIKSQQEKSSRRPIDSSMISSPVPNSFRHVAHMGVDEKGYVNSSWNVAPEWTKLLHKLEGYGVDAEMVEENLEFVKGFLAGAEAMRGSASSGSEDSHISYVQEPSKHTFLHLTCGRYIDPLQVESAGRTKRQQELQRQVPSYAQY